jgi:hypothetical protein
MLIVCVPDTVPHHGGVHTIRSSVWDELRISETPSAGCQQLLLRPVGNDYLIRVHQEGFTNKVHRTDSIRHSKFDGTWQSSKGKAMNRHIPCPAEKNVFSLTLRWVATCRSQQPGSEPFAQASLSRVLYIHGNWKQSSFLASFSSQ